MKRILGFMIIIFVSLLFEIAICEQQQNVKSQNKNLSSHDKQQSFLNSWVFKLLIIIGGVILTVFSCICFWSKIIKQKQSRSKKGQHQVLQESTRDNTQTQDKIGAPDSVQQSPRSQQKKKRKRKRDRLRKQQKSMDQDQQNQDDQQNKNAEEEF